MSDRPTRVGGSTAPNRMRLYATWVDKTPSNCMPRLCSLTLTHLVILRPLGSDVGSILLAVRMGNNKRTLRSNELPLGANGMLDTALDITFCLQYPHYLKRDGNKLHVLLQRRKRYKNRTMLGFKTLAAAVVRMDHVLQRQIDMELELVMEKDKTAATPLARLTVLQMSSTPVVDTDHKQNVTEHDFSDDDDEISSADEEAGDLSDIEPTNIRSAAKLPPHRHNLKQRFVALLRRFRVSETESDRAADLAHPSDIQALFQELESLSCDEESGPDQDTISISSTPKPSLRPFFSSSKSLLEQGGASYSSENDRYDEKLLNFSTGDQQMIEMEASVDGADVGEPSSPPPLVKQKHSVVAVVPSGGDSEGGGVGASLNKSKLFRAATSGVKKKNSLSDPAPSIQDTPRKSFVDQVNALLPLDETVLPDIIVLIGDTDFSLPSLSHSMRQFHPQSGAETKHVVNAVFNRINKYCNSSTKPPCTCVKVVIIGGDMLISWTIRPYIELLSTHPIEWLQFLRLYIVPLGNCSLTKYLSSFDVAYSSLFHMNMKNTTVDLVRRIEHYVVSASSAPPIAQLPIGEVMLTCQDDVASSQLFIPFINEVRLGPSDGVNAVDNDETAGLNPPSLTPPSSPNVQIRDGPWEPMELQLDFWQMPKFYESSGGGSGTGGGGSTTVIGATSVGATPPPISGGGGVGGGTVKGEKPRDGKNSIKSVFRSLQATPTTSTGLSLAIQLANKEKKQKIMRLGKKKEKDRDTELRNQTIDGVSRLICSARNNNTPMKVCIDGVEFNGVKFFQLSSTWQRHIKNLPVAMVGVPLTNPDDEESH